AAMGLIAVLVVDLWSIERMYWVFSPRAKTLFASDPAIDAIKADIAKTGQPARVWAEQRLATVEPLRDPNFIGDGLMTHGLSVVGGYHGNELGMYQRMVESSPQTFFMPPFWRHENVRYLYTVAPPSLVDTMAVQLGLTERPVLLSGPVRNAAGNMVYAYRLPGDMRPAIVATAMVKAPPDQALGTVLDQRFDPARAAIVDTSAKDVQPKELEGLPEPSKVKATVTSSTDGSYDIALDQPAPAGSALVVSENYYPGWHATADGKPAPTVRTNYNLIGVALPTGAQKVELRFTDAAYQKGKTLTFVTLAIAIALLGLGLVVDRRRSASHFAQA
ncbi:MAG TPA: YfhO family protein, partial [Gemmatimonadaceae bacterium]